MTWNSDQEDRLCALVELDLFSFGEIAQALGLDRNAVTSRFTRIKQRLGPQATTSHDSRPGDYVYPPAGRRVKASPIRATGVR